MKTLQITLIAVISVTLLSSGIVYADPEIIAQLQQKIAELEVTITGLETTVADLKEDKQAKNDRMDVLRDKLKFKTQDIEKLEAKIDRKIAKIDQLESKTDTLENQIADLKNSQTKKMNQLLKQLKAQGNGQAAPVPHDPPVVVEERIEIDFSNPEHKTLRLTVDTDWEGVGGHVDFSKSWTNGVTMNKVPINYNSPYKTCVMDTEREPKYDPELWEFVNKLTNSKLVVTNELGYQIEENIRGVVSANCKEISSGIYLLNSGFYTWHIKDHPEIKGTFEVIDF